MDKPNYYQKNRDVLLNKSKEYYRNNREHKEMNINRCQKIKKIMKKNIEKT